MGVIGKKLTVGARNFVHLLRLRNSISTGAEKTPAQRSN
jgi:hypothetical protein